MVNVIIGLYYAVVLGWAAIPLLHLILRGAINQLISSTRILKMGDISNGVSFEFVGMVTGPLIAVWLGGIRRAFFRYSKRDF